MTIDRSITSSAPALRGGASSAAQTLPRALLLVLASAAAGGCTTDGAQPCASQALLARSSGGASVRGPRDLVLTGYVDPLIGTGPSHSQGPVFGGSGGSTFPGATAPFGMVQWSPDTPHAEPSGYGYGDDTIEAFSLTHFNGAGCPNNEDFPIVPVVGPLAASPGSDLTRYASTFDHHAERAAPGYYAVDLRSRAIRVELTAARRAALGRFTYPASRDATLLIDASRHAAGATPGSIHIDGDRAISGSATAGNFCNSGQTFAIHFAAVFDRPFHAYGTWNGDQLTAFSRAAEGAAAGAYVTFDTSVQRSVLMKVAISYVRVDNARQNLGELPGWDFEGARRSADAAWNALLNRVQVSGGSESQLRQFYTALYHVFSNPNVYSDSNGQYLAFDGQVAGASEFVDYQNYSGWDVYRSWIPLMAMVAPLETRDIVRSLLDDAQRGGALPKWSHAGRETGVMVGDPGPIMVASAYAFGVRDFDAEAALERMHAAGSDASTRSQSYPIRPALAEYTSLHFVPDGPSQTLEYAAADFAISRFARALGDADKQRAYAARAGYWKNVWHGEVASVQARAADGTWIEPFDPASPAHFIEGNAAQYTWMVPHDLFGVFKRMGGEGNALARLDRLFSDINAGVFAPHFYIGNEPQFATPWAYTFAGAPWKTQQTLRRILDGAFSAEPGGLPGNDDLGATSSWFVWTALGLYPAIAGTDVLVLHGPLFASAVIRLGSGRTLEIHGRGAGSSAPYVKGVSLDGRVHPRSWLRFSEVAAGGVLDFRMDSQPNAGWGAAYDARPPSFASPEP